MFCLQRLQRLDVVSSFSLSLLRTIFTEIWLGVITTALFRSGNSDSGTKSNFVGHSGISPCNHRDIVGQRKWDNPWNVSNVYLSH